ncbi:MAG: TolC family protein, partial [Verrucomicrobia bacterium]|nr:TolC family protein [Verrucomicrobiota bacterium]
MFRKLSASIVLGGSRWFLPAVPSWGKFCLCAVLALAALAGCTAAHHRAAADKEVYRILRQKEAKVPGRTNDFNIDTSYSRRKPKEIPSVEIIQQRIESGARKLTLDEALKLSVENSRTFQFNKERLYLAALTLTRDRYDFQPHFLASSTATRTRDTTGEQIGEVKSQFSVGQLLQSGASLSVSLVNDVLQYYTGNPRRSATTLMAANITQPLLRGAGTEVVAENLKQSERNVIYEVRTFNRFQDTFAVDVVSAYYRLLQQKDAVRNQYSNYQKLVRAREEAEAKSQDRFSGLQVDQARQAELGAKTGYILAVQTYQTRLDAFKETLALPLGVELSLDDGALEELSKAGLIPLSLDERDGYRITVERRLDLLNEIDRFEDSKRKIVVAADRLKADLNIFANASLESVGPTDYAKFDLSNYHAQAGVQLNLPIDRLKERNDYRAALIAFERQIRSLALTLDDARNGIRQDLRTLEQTRQNYEIQKSAVALADRQVDGAALQLQAGRAQIRDLLEAQSAQLAARNALTAVLVDYHLARLSLLNDLGVLDTGRERFWLSEPAIPRAGEGAPGESAA